ncbi:MAG: reverse transcriptase domain-containing protein [Chloroflexi bacterium]|nr:reverse transcriptase domain-containing protein [Chloroflexota bacterium]
MSLNITLRAHAEDLQQKFFNLQTPEDIANLLEINSYNFLKYLIFVLPEKNRYTQFVIPKRNNGHRIILEPIPNLKIIQQKLLQVLNTVYEPKTNVHGFVHARSIVTNARAHVKKKYILNIDLKDFFPSIHFGRVRGMFMAHPYNLNEKVATVLAQICSLPKCLPQGAPTSPIISNMICAKMDSELQKLAKENRCFYTRFADDITFSTTVKQFPIALATQIDQIVNVGYGLDKIIHGNGFEINQEKVRLHTNKQRQEVTGLTTNLFVNVNRKFVRQVRAMLHAWEKFGYQSAENEYRSLYSYRNKDKPYKSLPMFQKIVKGKIEFIGMVRGREDRIFIKLNNKAAQLEQLSTLNHCLFQQILDKDDELIGLIAGGERHEVEFKVGASLNFHTSKSDKNMREGIIEAVTAFMNNVSAGFLLIGIGDDGSIWGVEREYESANPQKKNWDGYELFLRDILNSNLSITEPARFFTISPHIINGKTICKICVTKADGPVLYGNKLFIREGPKSQELKGADMVHFIRNWQQ